MLKLIAGCSQNIKIMNNSKQTIFKKKSSIKVIQKSKETDLISESIFRTMWLDY